MTTSLYEFRMDQCNCMNHDQYAQYSAQFSAGKNSLQNGEYNAAVETFNDMSER